MNTIRIERLDLRCRGIAPETAQIAAGALGAALQRHLAGGEAVSAGGSPDLTRVTATTNPGALADTIAARVAGIVRSNATRRGTAGDS